MRTKYEQRETAITARKHVLVKLIEAEGQARVEEVITGSDLPNEVVCAAIEQLKAQGCVEQDDHILRIPDPSARGYSHVLTIYREVLLPCCDTRVLGKPYYDRHINEHLLDEIVTLQGGISLSGKEKLKAIELLKLSPGALASSIVPRFPMVNCRSRGTSQQDIDSRNELDVAIFFKTLHECLRHDFHEQILAEYFFDIRQLAELDVTYSVTLKGWREVRFQDAARDRTILGEVDATSGQRRIVILFGLNDIPEPWEFKTSISTSNTAGRRASAFRGAMTQKHASPACSRLWRRQSCRLRTLLGHRRNKPRVLTQPACHQNQLESGTWLCAKVATKAGRQSPFHAAWFRSA